MTILQSRDIINKFHQFQYLLDNFNQLRNKNQPQESEIIPRANLPIRAYQSAGAKLPPQSAGPTRRTPSSQNVEKFQRIPQSAAALRPDSETNLKAGKSTLDKLVQIYGNRGKIQNKDLANDRLGALN